MKKIKRKLLLNQITIARLTDIEMDNIYGASMFFPTCGNQPTEWDYCPSNSGVCVCPEGALR